MALLEVKNLRTFFRTESGINHAVDGVSFTMERDRTLGIVGESGCGKSVTAMSIMRLVPCPPGIMAEGEILWKGRDILKVPAKDLPNIRGREIAMIFQDPMTSLNPVFKIGRILTEVLDKRFGLKGADAMKRAEAALHEVGISDAARRLENYPHELSGGMKQRVMIALALLCEPELLIADEPTTALDVTIQKQILFLMKKLQADKGVAIMLITHDLGVIAETCDDVAVMYAGRIVETCDVFTLFERSAHPYTRGLLNSLPKKGLTKDSPLPTIEGTVPQLFDPPKGCRFADRCPRVQPDCLASDPQLMPIGPGHFAACFHPVEQPTP
ncbi:ABC transporter ATP-binding protein [soil metagenome]